VSDQNQNKKPDKSVTETNTSRWEFKVEEKSLMDVLKKDLKRDENEKHHKIQHQEKKLRLDYSTQTRYKMANLKTKATQRHLKNKSCSEMIFAPVEKRMKALLLDFLFFVGLLFLSHFLARVIIGPDPDAFFKNSLLSSFFSYLYEFFSSSQTPLKFYVDFFSKLLLITFYLFFFILPQVFWGVSLGKKLSGLRIDHIDGGSLNLSQACAREFLGKLMSLITVAGPFLFFFTKNRRSLHDILSNSAVVEDSD